MNLLRVRDVRAELSKRLGIKIDSSKYKYFQHLGLVPGPHPNRKRKYDAYIRPDEVDTMSATIAQHLKKQNGSGKTTYRRPGVWRRQEVRAEIERRLGIPFPQWRFSYCRRVGIIPDGEIRIPAIKGGMTMHWGWSDAQVEEIIAVVSTHLEVLPIERE